MEISVENLYVYGMLVKLRTTAECGRYSCNCDEPVIGIRLSSKTLLQCTINLLMDLLVGGIKYWDHALCEAAWVK